MIFDKLDRAERYYVLNKHFNIAFEYIKRVDLLNLETGKYDIDGENAFMIIANGKPTNDFVSNLESHRKYIDVQIALEGSFGLKWKALEDCKYLIKDYDSEEDAILFSDESDFEVMLNPGSFAILMPEDAHCPLPPKSNLKKLILKIKV